MHAHYASVATGLARWVRVRARPGRSSLAAGLRYNRGTEAADPCASCPSPLPKMLDRRLVDRVAGLGDSAPPSVPPAPSERIGGAVKWAVVLLGCSIPVSVALDNILLGLILLFWIAGGRYREKLAAIRGNPVAVAGARAVCIVRRGIAVLDRHRQRRSRRADQGVAAAAHPGTGLSAARAGVARARHRRLPRVDARDARAVVSVLARPARPRRDGSRERSSTRSFSRRTSRTTCSWRSPPSCSPRPRSKPRRAAAGSRSLRCAPPPWPMCC